LIDLELHPPQNFLYKNDVLSVLLKAYINPAKKKPFLDRGFDQLQETYRKILIIINLRSPFNT